ncbi:hypothetical protein KAR52_02185 [Candidatus Pacearchaeota archaeon]|nr:hypothetical protein [Candidatus Pacearchaeota archaeon]
MKLEDKEYKLNNLKKGDIIRYKPGPDFEETYIIVDETKWGQVYGKMAMPVGISSISIEELVKQEFSLADFSK